MVNILKAKNKNTGEVREFEKDDNIYKLDNGDYCNESYFNSEWEVIEECDCKAQIDRATGEHYSSCVKCEEPKQTDIESIIEWDCFGDGCEECEVCKYLSFREYAESVAPSGSTIERNIKIENYLKKQKQKLSDLEQSTREQTLQEVREKIRQYKNYYNPIGDELNKGRHLMCEDLLTSLQRNDSEATLKDK